MRKSWPSKVSGEDVLGRGIGMLKDLGGKGIETERDVG